MGKKGSRILTWVLAAVLSITSVTAAFASERVISSVSLRVSSKLEADNTLPSISYNNNGSETVEDGEICVSNSASKYSISGVEWVTSDSKVMSVGDQPVLEVTLTANDDGSTEWYFKGSYRSSNVSVKGGTFVRADREDEDTLVVRIRVNAVKGTFAPPEDAYWKERSKGTARWEAPEEGGTGKYEVVLRRGSSKVHSVETTGTSYNFYPYMTVAGTYSFRVRTIARTTKEDDYGKKSEWIESDEIYLAKEDVSDGSGQTGSSGTLGYGPSGIVGNTKVGWQLIGGSWYYYYPDGTYQKDSWLQVGGKWYLFQGDGRMMKGWQRRNNQTYYLTDSGAMHTGWFQSNGRWYYLNPTPDAFEGAMLHDRWLDLDGKRYYLAADGTMVEGWYKVGDNWYYFYPGAGNMAANTWVDSLYVNAEGVWVR